MANRNTRRLAALVRKESRIARASGGSVVNGVPFGTTVNSSKLRQQNGRKAWKGAQS